MNRFEAIAIVRSISYRSLAAEWGKKMRADVLEETLLDSAIDEVDGLVALGVLKLDDEPSQPAPDVGEPATTKR